MPEPTPYRDLVARNVAAERERRSLNQAALADRMAAIGFRWVRQTVTEAERPDGRRITVEEIAGLAAVLGVPIDVLMYPPPGSQPYATLPGGRALVFRPGGRAPFVVDSADLGSITGAPAPDGPPEPEPDLGPRVVNLGAANDHEEDA